MKRTPKQVPENNSVVRQRLPVQLTFLVAFVVAGLLFAVWKIPQWQVGSAPLKIEEKARIDAETSARAALIQGIGGLLLFVTAGVSWQNLKATQRNVLVAEDKQVTERFSKAVEMLGNENSLYIRLGGIYALERIAKDSPKDHWQVIEVLTAFVREKARLKNEQKPFYITDHFAGMHEDFHEDPYGDSCEDYSNEDEWDGTTRNPNRNYIYPCPVDIQAILTALGRRIRTHENGEQHHLDLNQTDLRGIVLTGDLTGINLQGVNLQWAELKNVEMIGANLTKANLELAKFEGANLQGVNLEDAQLQWARFMSTKFCKANLKNVDFRETTFQESDLSQADLMQSNFSGAKLCRNTRDTLRHANLSEVDFSGVDLSEINFKNTDLKSVDFSKTNLSSANLTGANLEQSYLTEANLTEANLTGANLEDAYLEKANLSGANLTGANLEMSRDIDKVNLSGANLTGANLQRICLQEANLSGANLTEANLSHARLYKVRLEQANFYKSNLAHTTVTKVDFSSAQNLTLEQVMSMSHWEKATYSPDLKQKLDVLAETSE